MRVRTLIAIPLLALLLCTPTSARASTAGSAPSPIQLTGVVGASPGTGTGSALARGTTGTATTASAPQATIPEAPIPVAPSEIPPAGRKLSPDRVLALAEALPKMRAVRRKYPGSYGGAYLKGPVRWQVSFFSKRGAKEIGQVIIADASGRVLEQWTGFQVAWTMARGYRGAFGEHVNALYVWLPLCLLFLLPFIDWRRPFALLHLDLLVLLSFSVSLAFFNHAHIYASVPLTYPPLLYLLARMLALLRRRSASQPPRRSVRPLRLLVPAPVLALGIVSLLGFRIALNVTDANVIDVGYAGVIGAQRITHGEPLYGGYPADNEHGDTYGPVNYEVYVPFEQVFGWSGTWDDLPAAHAAAIVFDLLAVALLFLIGRRMRGPTLGIALAYAWVSFPFTLFALESDSNDTLVAVMILAALYFAGSPPVRGAFAALAGLTKFAPLALAPLLALHGLRERDGWVSISALRTRAFALFLLAFVAVAALVSIPALTHDSLHTIFQRTLVYQSNRGSPFSIWGLYGLHGLQRVVQIAAVALAVALAIAPRRDDLVGLAAACGAVIIAAQLGIDHWFYLYIPWFFPLVMIALLGRFAEPGSIGQDAGATWAAASAPARSSPLATA
jgi:Glycosyltransferase family 87